MNKILIIEDDLLMQRMYEKIFKFAGLEVELVDNGKEGLKKARSDSPSVILLDIMMPEMNGLEVLEEIKKDSKISHIPVAMLTNLSENKDAKKALSMGAEKYVVKSDQSPEELVSLVKGMLKIEEKKE